MERRRYFFSFVKVSLLSISSYFPPYYCRWHITQSLFQIKTFNEICLSSLYNCKQAYLLLFSILFEPSSLKRGVKQEILLISFFDTYKMSRQAIVGFYYVWFYVQKKEESCSEKIMKEIKEFTLKNVRNLNLIWNPQASLSLHYLILGRITTTSNESLAAVSFSSSDNRAKWYTMPLD